jgi:hypothetical protein
MTLTLNLQSGKSLVAEVAAKDAEAGRLLLERLADRAASLGPGTAVDVELDWARVRLRADEHRVYVDEPEYGGDARRFRPSLAITARLKSAQRQLMRRLNIRPQPVQARQYVHVSKQAMSAPSVVGFRREEENGPFTGWEIISTAEAPEFASFGYYRVDELAAQHPAWIIGLPLPAGWSLRFVGNTLIDCVSPAGETHAVVLSFEGAVA